MSPVSEHRLSLTEQGNIRYELKTPYRNGTTHMIFEPLDFISKLAALVPAPRVNLTRFHGVFGANSKHRSFLLYSQKSFLDSIINGTNSHNDDLIKNFNHYHFKSTSPLLLIGTKGDRDLPYSGAEIAYQQFKSQSDMVYIKHVSEILDHIQAVPPVIKAQLEFFKQYE